MTTDDGRGVFERAEEAAAFCRARFGDPPDVAVVLGSGLSGFIDTLHDRRVVPYGLIPHWSRTGVMGHPGRFVVGQSRGRRVIALAGRIHLYEGYSAREVTFPIRVLGRLGVKTVVLTNAAGAINTRFARGALMVIDDHINFTGTSPLFGEHDSRFGARFPDMSEVYSQRLRVLADAAAQEVGIAVEHGVYIGVAGPNYETPAEIRAFRTWGADAVGMSTVAEAIVARQMGMEVLGLSCISNMAAGVLPQPLSEEDVLETTRAVQGPLATLLEAISERL